MRLGVVLLCVACAAGQPAHGPKYTPENSPEPPTDCPAQAQAAKDAREAAIGADNMDAAGVAAEKVFAYAECERGAFDAVQLVEVDVDEISALRERYQSIRNLYDEVANYQTPRWSIAGLVRAGDLAIAYATKLRGLHAPSGTEQAADAAEIARLSTKIDEDAHGLYARALDASESFWDKLPADDKDVQGWLKSACAAVRQPGATLASLSYRACAR